MPPFARRARVWPGTPYPLGATWDGRGRQLRAVLAPTRQGRALPVRRAAAGASSSASRCPNTPTRSGTATCRTSRPGTLYGYRVHGPYEPEARPPLQPEQAAARPLCAGASSASCSWNDALFGYTIGAQRRGPVLRRARQRAASCRSAASIDPAFTWGDDRPPRTPWDEHDHLRDARARLHQAASRRAASALRGTFAGLGRRQVIDYLRALGVTAVELLPVHAFVDDRHLLEQGPDATTGATTRSASSRPTPRYLGRRGDVARVQGDGARAARRRPRGDPRRRLQPHRRRQRAAARRCRSRASTTRRTTGCCRTSRATTSTTPAPATR